MPPITAPHGMVATPHPAATAAGVDALRAGGSAVDAAVAANAMLAVVYANACGLGGDAFALVWDPAERRLHGLNGSGRSPAGLTIERVRAEGHDGMPQRGPLTINVPGAVDAWDLLLGRFGRRSLADALLPAAAVADDGVPFFVEKEEHVLVGADQQEVLARPAPIQTINQRAAGRIAQHAPGARARGGAIHGAVAIEGALVFVGRRTSGRGILKQRNSPFQLGAASIDGKTE